MGGSVAESDHFTTCPQCRAAGPETGTYLCDVGRVITRAEAKSLLQEIVLEEFEPEGRVS